jgi:hypothetical protein
VYIHEFVILVLYYEVKYLIFYLKAGVKGSQLQPHGCDKHPDIQAGGKKVQCYFVTHNRFTISIIANIASIGFKKSSSGSKSLARYCRFHRVHTEWQRPLSGIHWWKNFPRLATGGGGCTPTPFHYIYYHVQSCSVRSCSDHLVWSAFVPFPQHKKRRGYTMQFQPQQRSLPSVHSKDDKFSMIYHLR